MNLTTIKIIEDILQTKLPLFTSICIVIMNFSMIQKFGSASYLINNMEWKTLRCEIS
jgi:hypothetical protein